MREDDPGKAARELGSKEIGVKWDQGKPVDLPELSGSQLRQQAAFESQIRADGFVMGLLV
jgi:hypothetical protein